MLRIYRATNRLLASFPPIGQGRLAASLRGRRGAPDRWRSWAAHHRSEEPLVWFHASSVGEARVVEAVAAELSSVGPPVQCVLTYSSPSVSGWTIGGVRHTDFLPFDERRRHATLFAALQPSALAVARMDLWPELMREAARSGVPTAVIGVRMTPEQTHRRRWLTPLYGPIWRSVSWWGACTDRDAASLRHLGVPEDRVAVTGDPRHDGVLAAADNAEPPTVLRAWATGKTVVLAGSMHRSDEGVLLRAFADWRSRRADARLWIVPHEPSAATTRRVVKRCNAAGLSVAIWTGTGPSPADDTAVLLIPTSGMLQALYRLGAAAYVGGGFDRGGVHSVAEPVACGVPAVVGPRAMHDDDVRALAAAGACTVLPQRGSVVALQAAFNAASCTVGRAMPVAATLQPGAARRTAARLIELLDS
ncbi:MAG TPA: glycosyltransferase N-terminal domain-containing protein [Gemmatimonadales bacterium]